MTGSANASAGGNHTVIFSRWASPPLEHEGINYRMASCFSQGTPDRGGREHISYLGDRFAKVGENKVCPITSVSRDSSSSPVKTPEELLPKLGKSRGLGRQSGFRRSGRG